jgi:hypothetical protein
MSIASVDAERATRCGGDSIGARVMHQPQVALLTSLRIVLSPAKLVSDHPYPLVFTRTCRAHRRASQIYIFASPYSNLSQSQLSNDMVHKKNYRW